jgi:hypothetical protein
MDLTLREEYWIKFCATLIAVISRDNYYSQFHRPFCELVHSSKFIIQESSNHLKLYICSPSYGNVIK